MSKALNRLSSGKFTRELDKESLLYQSPIYTKYAWFMLLIISPVLLSILHSHVYLISYSILQYESVDRLWTRVRVRTLDNYQSTTDIGLERHVTWKSCDRVQSGLEGLRVQKDREESRWSRVRSDVKGHGFLMVYTWCAHVQRRLKV